MANLSGRTELQAHYDVVVVGAGLVGSTAALGLEKLGLSILVLDRAEICLGKATKAHSDVQRFDERSTAISHGSVEILSALDIWNAQNLHACPIHHVHVSEQGRLGTTRLGAQELGFDALGYVVPNTAFGRCLESKLLASEIDLLSGTQLIAANYQTLDQQAGFQLIVGSAERASPDNDATIDCKLLLAVDGAQSETCKLLGIDAHVKDYGQRGIVANVQTQLANQGCAFERFSKLGPLAMLPLKEHISALVWSVSIAQFEELNSLDDKAFCQQLEESFGDRLGVVEGCSERISFPLKLSLRNELYRNSFAVLGNAAHSLHPVAGQGFNLALRGVAVLLDSLKNAQHEQGHIGDTRYLSCLDAVHGPDQKRIVGLSDYLIDIFAEQSVVPPRMRQLGLVSLNAIPALKKEFAKQTMGLAGKKFSLGANQ
jgi:2-octaprenyl-6-methoxyphenol hydroxylase